MREDVNVKGLSDRELLELMRCEMNFRFEKLLVRLEQMDERVGKLEAGTNPLPPNYDARFAALERDVKDIKREMRQLRDHDWQREGQLVEVRERLEALESTATT